MENNYPRAEALAEQGELYQAALLYAQCLNHPEHPDAKAKSQELWRKLRQYNRGSIACWKHVIAVKNDGTVIATAKEPVLKDWTDITAVAAGEDWFAGLTAGGKVLVTQRSLQEEVADWTDITQIAAGLHHIVGLKADGTVVAAGDNQYGQCDVEEWTGVTEIAAGENHTVGITSWGTLHAIGDNGDGKCNACREDWEWTDVTQIACGCDHIVTVDNDGGMNLFGDGETGDWRACGSTEIAAVFDGRAVMGLLLDGRSFCAGMKNQVRQQHEYESVFTFMEWGIDEYSMDRDNINAAYRVDEWQGIVAITSGYAVTVGLCADGTLRAVFAKSCMGQYFETPDFSEKDIAGWKDLRVVLTETQVSGEGAL